jgi:esterase/lipase superfamily enzyme
MRPGASVSRRSLLRVLGAGASVFALEGCSSLAGTGAGLPFDAAELTSNPTLLVATTRKPANGGRSKPWFGSERAARMTLARARLKAPSEGRFSLSSIGLDDWRLEAIAPVANMGELLPPSGGMREVLLYVHGFNQTFETAAIDAANLSSGIRFRGPSMVFAWPSKAKLFDYGYDRESAMWSRDALEDVLSGLISSPAVSRIHVVAHSVGTMLTLEAIRQIYDRHGGVVVERIGTVVFASPDIDMDVFSSSVQRIGPLASKITVITSTKDRALAVSSLIAGGITRVGAAEQTELKRLGLQVVDASQEGWGIINHDLFLSNAHIQRVIRRAIDGQPQGGASASAG